MNYYRKAWDIAGYTYRAETLCPSCIKVALMDDGILWPGAGNALSIEAALDVVAEHSGIDRYDEWMFDSDDFPKVIFESQIDDHEECDWCGEEL